jgi:predicted DCC family thiol-disulfide oxidoreductase YuxK
MHLITPEGKVVGGLEAAVQAVATRPIMRFLVYAYYLPGVRFLGDGIYSFLAAHRYHIMGKVMAADACEEGTCSAHFQQGKKG